MSGPAGAAVVEGLADIAPDLGRMTVEFGYGDVYAGPDLTLRQRQIINVAALTALGTAAPQLRFHIGAALHVGVTRREIVETILHMTVYAGFPAAINGIAAAREAFTAAGNAEDPVSEPTAGNRYERGLEALRQIDGHVGEQVIASLADIAPDLARYIIEFSFGDVYSRGGLDLRTRELATVAACTAMGTAAPQLRVHLHGLLNAGGTRAEAVAAITQMAAYAGLPAAINGIAAARAVFAERDASAEP
ncbi:MAG: carboxymuconolactone decarboxylase family protein [Nocardiopsaceae bacterium]|nr:carboxymuconolactone decarboxylase family protein [Nocardiopsaceae bacterium]